jgi:hypothetical protein
MKSVLVKAVLLVICSFATLMAHAQGANSCTYSYSFSEGGFSFCLTPYGTLASLQGSGGNMLDPINPVEGFVACNQNIYNGIVSTYIYVPGLFGGVGPAPTVLQPNGVGKLPIIFEGAGFDLNNVTVKANPETKTVTFIMPVNGSNDQGEPAFGPMMRVMGLGSTSSVLSTLNSSALAYAAPADLVELNAKSTHVGYFNPGVSPVAFGGGNSTCRVEFTPPVVGEGFIYNMGSFMTGLGQVVEFSYRVF